LHAETHGGRWSDTGINIGGYQIYVHDTATGGRVGNSEDAYVAVRAPTPGSVHVNHPVP
jgi:hypothetical protein